MWLPTKAKTRNEPGKAVKINNKRYKIALLRNTWMLNSLPEVTRNFSEIGFRVFKV